MLLHSIYSDDSRDTETIAVEEQYSGNQFWDVESASQGMRLGKASGEGGMTADLMVKIRDPGIDFLIVFFDKIYEEGEIPGEFRKSTLISIPKKPRAQECTDFRTIALLSHVRKVLQKILLNKMRFEKRAKWKPEWIFTT